MGPSENSSPLLVSQAGYWPVHKLFNKTVQKLSPKLLKGNPHGISEERWGDRLSLYAGPRQGREGAMTRCSTFDEKKVWHMVFNGLYRHPVVLGGRHFSTRPGTALHHVGTLLRRTPDCGLPTISACSSGTRDKFVDGLKEKYINFHNSLVTIFLEF